MIGWFRQLGQAARNLARIARQNPVWAVQSLVFAPFRFARHLLGVLLLMVAVTVVLILGSDAVMWYLGLLRYPTLVSIVQVLIWLAILVIPLTRTARLASPPMPKRGVSRAARGF